MSLSIKFFDDQFRRQVEAGDYALNPFEQLALQYTRGRVLDLGCGLGNLALALARHGAPVTAVDASPNAIARLRAAQAAEGLDLDAIEADIANWPISGSYDTLIAIGLFMFFPRETAMRLLANALAAVKPGGCAIVNVLTEGTTYFGMFEPGHYHLFGESELLQPFAGWNILVRRDEDFPAPGGTVKRFTTLVAKRPGERGR